MIKLPGVFGNSALQVIWILGYRFIPGFDGRVDFFAFLVMFINTDLQPSSCFPNVNLFAIQTRDMVHYPAFLSVITTGGATEHTIRLCCQHQQETETSLAEEVLRCTHESLQGKIIFSLCDTMNISHINLRLPQE